MNKLVTLSIGEFYAHITQLHCKPCKRIYYPEDIKSLFPKNSRFCFDTIIYVGTALFVHHRNNEEIQQSLKEKNILISL